MPTGDDVVMPLWPLTSEWATSPQPGTVVATGLCGDGKLVLSYDGGVRHFRYRNAVAMSWRRWQLATIATATRDDGGWRDVPTYCCYYYYHSSLGYGMDDQLATTLRDLDNCCILASSSSAESDDDCEPGWTGSAGGSHVAGDYAYEPGWTGSAGGSPVDGGCSDAVSLDGPVPPGAAPRVPLQRGLGDLGLPH